MENKEENKKKPVLAEKKERPVDLNKVLESLPQNQREELTGAFLAMQEQKSFSGPLPAPEDFMAYKDVLPSAPERILAMAEQQLAHRIKMESKIVDAGILESRIGQFLGAILCVICFVFAYFLGINGHDVLAGSMVTIMTTVVIVFVLRQSPKNDKQKDTDSELLDKK